MVYGSGYGWECVTETEYDSEYVKVYETPCATEYGIWYG
jgi:hypothetical protein